MEVTKEVILGRISREVRREMDVGKLTEHLWEV